MLFRINVKCTLRVHLTVILKSVLNFSNTLRDKNFHVLEILKILLRITIKYTLSYIYGFIYMVEQFWAYAYKTLVESWKQVTKIYVEHRWVHVLGQRNQQR